MPGNGTPVLRRKNERFENRKRKLKAFLDLVQSQQSNKQEHRELNSSPRKKLKGMVKLQEGTMNKPDNPMLGFGQEIRIQFNSADKKLKKTKYLNGVKDGAIKKKRLKKSTKTLLHTASEVLVEKDPKRPEETHSSVTEDSPNGDTDSTSILEEQRPLEPPKLDTTVSECNYSELKQMKREITNTKLPWPMMQLTLAGFRSQITKEDGERKPLTMRDIQTSILHLLMPGKFPIPGRWARIVHARMISHKVTVVIEGVGIKDLMKCIRKKDIPSTNDISDDDGESYSRVLKSRDSLPEWVLHSLPRTCSSLLPVTFELVPNSPSNPLEDLVCLTSGKVLWNVEVKDCESEKVEESVDRDVRTSQLVVPVVSSSEDSNSTSEIEERPNHLPPSDNFDRRSLLLSPSDLYLHQFPVPFMGDYQEEGYAYTKDKYVEVKSSSPMFGIDCEMCLTCTHKLELTSISVVNEELKLVYHKLVKPPNKIMNYLTRFSGITEEMLENVSTTLQDVHSDLRALLPPDAIIVGHSLNNDLKAMKMLHPYIIDTAVAYNLSFIRQKPSALKVLTHIFLGKDIQMDPGGHDPTEDAAATLELVQLKLKKGFKFGNVIEGFKVKPADMEEYEELSSQPIRNSFVNGIPDNYVNLFQHAVANKVKTALLMTTSSAKSSEHILQSVSEESIDIHVLKGNKELSKKAAAVAMSKDFTYLHMKMSKIGATKSKKHYRKQLTKLDKRLQRVFNGACQKSLIMYIFTGSSGESSSNGLVMCCIKGMEEMLPLYL